MKLRMMELIDGKTDGCMDIRMNKGTYGWNDG
jgi:hypothetical protein